MANRVDLTNNKGSFDVTIPQEGKFRLSVKAYDDKDQLVDNGFLIHQSRTSKEEHDNNNKIDISKIQPTTIDLEVLGQDTGNGLLDILNIDEIENSVIKQGDTLELKLHFNNIGMFPKSQYKVKISTPHGVKCYLVNDKYCYTLYDSGNNGLYQTNTRAAWAYITNTTTYSEALFDSNNDATILLDTSNCYGGVYNIHICAYYVLQDKIVYLHNLYDTEISTGKDAIYIADNSKQFINLSNTIGYTASSQVTQNNSGTLYIQSAKDYTFRIMTNAETEKVSLNFSGLYNPNYDTSAVINIEVNGIKYFKDATSYNDYREIIPKSISKVKDLKDGYAIYEINLGDINFANPYYAKDLVSAYINYIVDKDGNKYYCKDYQNAGRIYINKKVDSF